MRKYDVILKPLVTEKSTLAKEKQNAYVFKVDAKATKQDIKQSVEKFFSVKVKGVTTLNLHGHRKRYNKGYGMTKAWKKAYVTLSEGKIELFEGV